MSTYHNILQLQAPVHISLQCRHVLHPGWRHQPHYSANSIIENNKNWICMNCVTKQLYFPAGWKFPCINSLSFPLVPLVYKLVFLFSSDKDIHTLYHLSYTLTRESLLPWSFQCIWSWKLLGHRLVGQIWCSVPTPHICEAQHHWCSTSAQHCCPKSSLH